ncbi:MAG: hypothetical protein KF787_02790 [Phycisphaeraceae bacterium]|nr:hypothetical protein [Phycisphaerae bacterium]MBX3391554.1 hypothetical protein [Phycisphaeraceae bacterium]
MPGRVHVILTTHTTRHLRRSLLGVAFQDLPAAEVIVSCDNDQPEIAAVVRECSAELGRAIVVVQRAFTGECRVGQARNNGLRALVSAGAELTDRVLYLDGDCSPSSSVVRVHGHRGERVDLLVGFRVELTPEQTEAFDEGAVRAGRDAAILTPEQARALARRDRRYRRQLFLRRFGLVKRHKPKVLSAHFSVGVGAILRVNGFDEEFTGWGQEDDDVGRRLHGSGASAGVVVREALVLHQWHPTRAPGVWKESAGVERFRRRLPWRCARGVTDPIEQPPVTARRFEGGIEVNCREVLPPGHRRGDGADAQGIA